MLKGATHNPYKYTDDVISALKSKTYISVVYKLLLPTKKKKIPAEKNINLLNKDKLIMNFPI